jgi:putative tryptophan/tyrosine transport system substrate-binding protein
MKRREFIMVLSGAAAAWPLAARAQRLRRLGVLMGSAESDLDSQVRLKAFREALRQMGWTAGGNLRIDYRWAAADLDRVRAYAAELVDLAPDVILAHAPAALKALKREARTVPIVFVMVPVPVAREVVASFARPGGNITGFAHTDVEIAGKWLELLKEVSPAMKRVAFLLDPDHPAWAGYSRTITATASSFGVEVTPGGIRDAAEIERVIEDFARGPNGGLIVLPDILTQVHRDLLVRLAARHRLPAIYGFRYFPASGGLMSYGIDPVDLFRRAATYIDRILKGAKAGELPVQAPTKFELVINLKTAKAMGLDVPWFLQQRADEVIE